MEEDKKLILVAEDEEPLRKLYRQTLEQEGFAVEEAADGQQAFEMLKRGGYDLILLDLKLPKIYGLDVLRKLQQDPPIKPNGPVLVLTNVKEEKSIALGVELGIRGYLFKADFTTTQLIDEVKKVLEWKMSNITIDSHDFLGKLTTIKNHLFVALESIPQKSARFSNPRSSGLPQSHKEFFRAPRSAPRDHHPKARSLLEKAYRANEELISKVKKLTKKAA